MSEVIITFKIMPESIERLSERLWKRPNADQNKIKTRIDMVKQEIKIYKPICDFPIINAENKLENTVNQIIRIITAKS